MDKELLYRSSLNYLTCLLYPRSNDRPVRRIGPGRDSQQGPLRTVGLRVRVSGGRLNKLGPI